MKRKTPSARTLPDTGKPWERSEVDKPVTELIRSLRKTDRNVSDANEMPAHVAAQLDETGLIRLLR